MERQPTVSVIAPVYNAERALSRLVESLRAQSYPADRVEVLLVDNGSTDRSWEMIQAYPDVRGLRETRLQTPGAPRNLGMREATGDVIALIDVDCWAHADWMRQGVRALVEGNHDRVAGPVQFVHSPYPSIYEHFDAAVNFRQRDFVAQRWSGSGNLFLKRTMLDDVGLFDATLRSGMDYEFGVRASDRGKSLGFSPGALCYHHTRRSFKSLFKKFVRTGYGVGQLYRKYGYFETSAFFRKANYRPVHGRWREFPEPEALTWRERVQIDLLWNTLRMASNIGNCAGYFDLFGYARKL